MSDDGVDSFFYTGIHSGENTEEKRNNEKKSTKETGREYELDISQDTGTPRFDEVVHLGCVVSFWKAITVVCLL